MNKQVSFLTNEQLNTQEVFWTWISKSVRQLVADLAQKALELIRDSHLDAGWQSCTFHRLSNLRLAIGQTDFRNRMVAEASCIFRCPSREAALDVAVAWRKRWQPLSPWPVYQFLEGLSDSLTFYNLPMWWWKRARTNNPMERLIKTLRQPPLLSCLPPRLSTRVEAAGDSKTRGRPMGCFHDDSAIERAVFGQLLRWHKIKLTHNT
jgi:hypothetical protein